MVREEKQETAMERSRGKKDRRKSPDAPRNELGLTKRQQKSVCLKHNERGSKRS